MKSIRGYGSLEKRMDMVKHIFRMDTFLIIMREIISIINAVVKDF
jgi:hypothetical protein